MPSQITITVYSVEEKLPPFGQTVLAKFRDTAHEWTKVELSNSGNNTPYYWFQAANQRAHKFDVFTHWCELPKL